MHLRFVNKHTYPAGFRLPENFPTVPWRVEDEPLSEEATCYVWRPEAMVALGNLRLAACVGSIWGLEKEDVDVEKVVWRQCLSLRKPELVLMVRWPEGDERLDQVVAASSANWKLLKTALETGGSVRSAVPVRGGGATKKRVRGPVKAVEAWVWDAAVHFTDSGIGVMDWMPSKPPGCKEGDVYF